MVILIGNKVPNVRLEGPNPHSPIPLVGFAIDHIMIIVRKERIGVLNEVNWVTSNESAP